MIENNPFLRCFILVIQGWLYASTVLATVGQPVLKEGAFHVHPGQSIQAALDMAAEHAEYKDIYVYEGTYRPQKKGQAFIYLNRKHDGIHLKAKGEVILTAANSDLADPEAESFPAIVNHVVYFGDGISKNTTFDGFKITGANNFVTDVSMPTPMEPSFTAFRKTEGFYGSLFFYTDGGGIKVFGRSYPVISNVEIYDCFASPCGAAVSIEHRGFNNKPVVLENCVFRNNRSLVTGSAVDLLPKSAASIQNCLFVGNISNTGLKYERYRGNIDWPEIPKLMATTVQYQQERGSGALTVFFGSRIQVDRCTFTGNFNGVDDRAAQGVYRRCLFWKNNAKGGMRTGERYELDILEGKWVLNCMLGGTIADPLQSISVEKNIIDCEDPQFDENYIPLNPKFEKVGYRPR